MKKSLLFILTGAALLMASCNNPATPAESSKDPGQTSQGQTSADTQGEESSSRSSRTRTTSSSEEAKEAELPETLPEIEGTNVTYFEGLQLGGEADADGAFGRGKVTCWTGDGGVNYSFKLKEDEVVLEYGIGWAWYGVQIFYQPIYAEPGDIYTMRLRMHTDAAGQITINGQVTDLVLGWNVITMDVTTPAQVGKSTVSIQLGVNGGEAFTGTTLRMKELELYDKAHTYFPVSFASGEKTLKEINVRENKTVTAPFADAPNGKVFYDWYNGEETYLSTVPVTAKKDFVAKFVNESETTVRTVSYSLNGTTIDSQKVADGGKAQVSAVTQPYGYVIDGWFADNALAQAYPEGSVTQDLTIYGKGRISPVLYIHNGQCYHETGYGENGETIESFKNHGFDAGWHIQVNFGNFPVGDAGKRYSFTIDYKLDGTTDAGSFQVYDEAIVQIDGSNGALTADGQWHTISFTYEGESFLPSAKFTMELGLVHPSGAGDDAMFNLSLRNLLHRVA